MKTYAIARRSSISLDSGFITPDRFAFTTPRLRSDGVTLNILHYQGELISPPQHRVPGLFFPGGVFNVIVIGIEFQINQALYFFYDTKIALPAHFQEIGLRLQMPVFVLLQRLSQILNRLYFKTTDESLSSRLSSAEQRLPSAG